METTTKFLKVSLIIPVFNSFKYVDLICKSIGANENSIEEIIFVNDGGSVSDFQQLVESIKNRFQNVKYFSYEQNEGPWKARNIAVANASQDIIAFYDTDDLLPSNSIFSRVKLLDENSTAKFVCSSYRWLIDGEEKGMNHVLQKFGKSELLQTCFVCTPSVVMRRSVFNEAGGFRKIGAEDFDLWIRILSGPGSYALGDTSSHVLITSNRNSVSSNKLRSARWYFAILKMNEKRKPVQVLFFFIYFLNVLLRRYLKIKTRPLVIRSTIK